MSLANNNCIVCYPAWATILFLKDLTHGLFLSLSWISILVHNILKRWNFSSVYQLYFLHRGNASLANLCCNLIVSLNIPLCVWKEAKICTTWQSCRVGGQLCGRGCSRSLGNCFPWRGELLPQTAEAVPFHSHCSATGALHHGFAKRKP